MIDNTKISKFAISVIKTLQNNNFEAYLVGGCVRDALSGIEPKDFDIATNATPDEVRKIFKASRIIGKRFKLVHVFDRSELLEVATFRSDIKPNEDESDLIKDNTGKIIRDNVWGTLEQDCFRRDFTINALYYCPITKKIEDRNNGLRHIQKKIPRQNKLVFLMKNKSVFSKKLDFDGKLYIKIKILAKTKMARMGHRDIFYKMDLKKTDPKWELWRETDILEAWENNKFSLRSQIGLLRAASRPT